LFAHGIITNEEIQMPKFIMLCGIPGSGKSTYKIKLASTMNNPFVYSTDDIIIDMAKSQGETYIIAFQKYYKQAKKEMNKLLAQAIADGRDIIWDQTNIQRQTRHHKLKQIPNHYETKLVFITCSDIDELKSRITNRKDQQVSWEVVKQMMDRLEPPSGYEEFDMIEIVDTRSSSLDDSN